MKRRKKRRKEMLTKVPENWVLGFDRTSYEQGSKFDRSRKRKKVAPPPANSPIANESLDDRPRTDTTAFRPSEPSLVTGFEHRPLDNWLLHYASANGKTPRQVKREVLGSMKKRARAPAERGQKTGDEEAMRAFFREDPDDDEPFGEDPEEYSAVKRFREELEKNDELYDKSGRLLAKGGARPSTMQLQKLEENQCGPAYCADFLREAIAVLGERPCREGDGCIFMKMAVVYPSSLQAAVPGDAFVCREFLPPAHKNRPLPELPRLCLGCNRLTTTLWVYRFIEKDEEPAELLQDHCNSVDEDGQYNSDYCWYPGESRWIGIARPMVKFSRSHYIYRKIEVPVSNGTVKAKGVLEAQTGFH